MTPRRGDIWAAEGGIGVLVVSSTVYNEIASEPTVIVVPVFDTELDTGFGVDLGRGSWAAPGSPAPPTLAGVMTTAIAPISAY